MNVKQFLDDFRKDLKDRDQKEMSDQMLVIHKHNLIIDKVISQLEDCIKAQSRLLVCYRTGSRPPEWVHKSLDAARKSGIDI